VGALYAVCFCHHINFGMARFVHGALDYRPSLSVLLALMGAGELNA